MYTLDDVAVFKSFSLDDVIQQCRFFAVFCYLCSVNVFRTNLVDVSKSVMESYPAIPISKLPLRIAELKTGNNVSTEYEVSPTCCLFRVDGFGQFM